MREEDLRVRAETIQGAPAFDGYHSRMKAVHTRNAKRLKQIIAQYGWPGRTLVGEDGMIAAWFIVQHAISDPPFQRQVLQLLKDKLAEGEVSAQSVAFLEDRICVFKGRPQIYGTQFEPDDRGMYHPSTIGDSEHVNERRSAVGMNSIEERTRQINEGQQPEEVDPERLAEYRRKHLEWLRRVGWRT
jgi:hypothetical protein